ncbi:MAG: tol-pal system protein YbgF [Rhizobiales bacterium]|nr:tol-pal system protein YbgF [Hyphomicrobiales bacterium]
MRPIRHSTLAAGLLLGAVLAFPGATVAQAQDAAELFLRLDRLEAENRRLNGKIEEMTFQVRRLEDQLKRQQTDSDLRFRDLEQGRPGGARPQTPAAPQQGALPNGAIPVPTPQTNRRQDAFDPAQTPAAPGAPRPLTPGSTGDINAPLDVTRPRNDGTPPVASLPRGDARSDFEAARALIQSGDNEGAERAFRGFLSTHPRDRRAADATFFLGESYINRTRYREAAEHYLTVTTKFSNSARAPEAMLKLGISLRGLGAKAEACGTFEQVPRKYPNASAAIRAAVEREKARAQC